MSVINTQSRQAKARAIRRSLSKYFASLLAFFAITGGLGFFFPNNLVLQKIFGSPPDVRFQILSPVTINSLISQGIVITNRGGESAREMIIDIIYTETLIVNEYYDQDVFTSLHDVNISESKKVIQFKIDQLRPNVSGIIYIAINKTGETPKAVIEYQNGAGREEIYDTPKIFIWLMSIGGASAAMLVFLLMRRFWRFITS